MTENTAVLFLLTRVWKFRGGTDEMFNLSHHLCVLSETPCQTGAEATSVQHATGRFTTRRKCSVMARASINAVFSAVSTSNASKCKYNFIWNKTEQRSCHQRRPRRSRTALELCFASSGHLRKLALTFRSPQTSLKMSVKMFQWRPREDIRIFLHRAAVKKRAKQCEPQKAGFFFLSSSITKTALSDPGGDEQGHFFVQILCFLTFTDF